MKRITKDIRIGYDSITYVVREYLFNLSLGLVRVKVYTSESPLQYELYEFSDIRANMRDSYYDSSDRKLYDDYFCRDYCTLPRPKIYSLSRPKYFGKFGRPLAAYYYI